MIDKLRNLPIIQMGMLTFLILNVSISFSIFSSLQPLSYLVLYESSCLKLSASKFMASIINLFFCSIFLLEFTQALKFLLQLMDAIGNLLISWQEV